MSKIRLLSLVIGVSLIVLIALYGWKDLYKDNLEIDPPIISLVDSPGSLGIAPAKLTVKIEDKLSGLDSFRISIRQDARTIDIASKEDLNRLPEADVNIDIPGVDSTVEAGRVSLIVDSTDSSWWKNSKSISFDLIADYNKPVVEPVQIPESLTIGVPSLFFYRVSDEDLGESGVTIGKKSFTGYRAEFFNENLKDPTLYGALVVAPQNIEESRSVKIYAEDRSSNNSEITLSTQIQQANSSAENIEVTDLQLRQFYSPLAQANEAELLSFKKTSEFTRDFYKTEKGTEERFLEQFTVVETLLRTLNRAEISGAITQERFERFWKEPFNPIAGKILYPFGSKLNYTVRGSQVLQSVSNGYTIVLPKNITDVSTFGSGYVVKTGDFGVFGRSVIIDHGLGLTSVVGRLQNVIVEAGKILEAGEVVGYASPKSEGEGNEFYFETLIKGVPCDARTFTNPQLYYDRIQKIINKL